MWLVASSCTCWCWCQQCHVLLCMMLVAHMTGCHAALLARHLEGACAGAGWGGQDGAGQQLMRSQCSAIAWLHNNTWHHSFADATLAAKVIVCQNSL
jgi:hypothetical protein